MALAVEVNAAVGDATISTVISFVTVISLVTLQPATDKFCTTVILNI